MKKIVALPVVLLSILAIAFIGYKFLHWQASDTKTKHDCKRWTVKARDGKQYILKQIPHGSPEKDEAFFAYAEKIFARSFAPLYPEAGAKKYAIKNQMLTEGTQVDIQQFTQERKRRLVKLIKEHPEEIHQYAQEYLVADFRNRWITPFKKLIEKKELASFVLFQDDQPIGFAIFTKSFVKDGKIIPAEKGTKILKLLALDPVAQGKGLSRHLIFSVLKQFPQTKKIRVRTGVEKDIITGKRKHEQACQVYVRYGFKPYFEPRVNYDPEKKQFFVWENPNI